MQPCQIDTACSLHAGHMLSAIVKGTSLMRLLRGCVGCCGAQYQAFDVIGLFGFGKDFGATNLGQGVEACAALEHCE